MTEETGAAGPASKVSDFNHVFHHRLKYFLTPQLDLYKNIRTRIAEEYGENGLLILDYGCGNGVGTVVLYQSGLCRLPHAVVGIDKDPCAIDFAVDVFGHLASFACDDWTGRHYHENCQYDVIVCVEVIEHVEHAGQLLQAFSIALRPGGMAFISTLNHNSQYRKNRGHLGRYTVTTFSELVRYNGFPGAMIADYELNVQLHDESTITPMVAIWRKGNP